MGEALQETEGHRAEIEAARLLVVDAIVRLDTAGAPADIAAHLDLALHRMTTEVEAV